MRGKRERWKRGILQEIRTELYSCCHSIALIFTYSMLKYFYDFPGIDFIQVFGCMLLGYLMAWTQELLFWKGDIRGKLSAVIRNLLWVFLPMAYAGAAAAAFGWFVDGPPSFGAWFFGIFFFYLAMLWWILKRFYEREMRRMNDLLENFKRGG